jgi:hypothetical protein
MRDLSRAREAAQKDLQGKRQQVSSFMLRLGRHYPGKKTWGRALWDAPRFRTEDWHRVLTAAASYAINATLYDKLSLNCAANSIQPVQSDDAHSVQ